MHLFQKYITISSIQAPLPEVHAVYLETHLIQKNGVLEVVLGDLEVKAALCLGLCAPPPPTHTVIHTRV